MFPKKPQLPKLPYTINVRGTTLRVPDDGKFRLTSRAVEAFLCQYPGYAADLNEAIKVVRRNVEEEAFPTTLSFAKQFTGINDFETRLPTPYTLLSSGGGIWVATLPSDGSVKQLWTIIGYWGPATRVRFKNKGVKRVEVFGCYYSFPEMPLNVSHHALEQFLTRRKLPPSQRAIDEAAKSLMAAKMVSPWEAELEVGKIDRQWTGTNTIYMSEGVGKGVWVASAIIPGQPPTISTYMHGKPVEWMTRKEADDIWYGHKQLTKAEIGEDWDPKSWGRGRN